MINDQSFRALAERQSDICVSIYLPTYRSGRVNEDQLRMKNALKQARHALQDQYGMKEAEAESFLKRGRELYEDERFWSRQSDGLAVFIGPGFFQYESVPVDFEPIVQVGSSYYLRPLIPALSSNERFYLLALSQGAVKLYEAGRTYITPIEVGDLIPQNMQEALLLDDPQAQIQHHSGNGGSNQAIFHGHGKGHDDKNAELKDYFDQVDRGLREYFCDDDAPLLLAGVDYLIPIYRNANKYNYLLEDIHVSGNVEHDNPALLHEKAWAKVAPFFDQQRKRDLQLFEDNLAQNEASFSIHDVVPAAINGRVTALFVNKDQQVYGTYDESTNTISLNEDSRQEGEDLLNRAAVTTYLTGGRVYNLARTDLPRPTSDIAAIYRYNY